ncbi:hypothetical protein SAMN02744133_10822 [Thalassospira xiamenensis M-5 = DSM 17429]|uniref:PKD domain-containing protein n=1 Tax=Thalassospira xiamenensis M-5 = DSM 17429 TaxID=1123366 RepID=A0AB72UIN6_9PROT|nr:PKD domain-containing protein [Thalassospira xiamenensis]AJD54301.1 hypothetical protein TH3_21143 [Thalassospira xiamenensis M-5 = DSM 17429]SIT20967.1 hypothetical protein SAMN02744133_10822 [Thalassospira xiamenensis M-5 = DSM 17429]
MSEDDKGNLQPKGDTTTKPDASSNYRFKRLFTGKRGLAIWGGIFALIISMASGLFPAMVDLVLNQLEKPKARISGPSGKITISSTVHFDGGGSTSGSEIIKYDWTLNGIAINRFGDCQPIGTKEHLYRTLRCTFSVPGRYLIGLNVYDTENNQSSETIELNVVCPRCFYGIAFHNNHSDKERVRNISRELIYGLNWQELAKAFDRPVVIYDADSGFNVFVRSFSGIPEQRAVERPTGALQGLEIGIPGEPEDRALVPVYAKFVESLEHLGAIPRKSPEGFDMFAAYRPESFVAPTFAELVLANSRVQEGESEPWVVVTSRDAGGSINFTLEDTLLASSSSDRPVSDLDPVRIISQFMADEPMQIGFRLISSKDQQLVSFNNLPDFADPQFAGAVDRRLAATNEAIELLQTSDTDYVEELFGASREFLISRGFEILDTYQQLYDARYMDNPLIINPAHDE